VVRSPSGRPLADHGTWVRGWNEALAKPDGHRVVHRLS